MRPWINELPFRLGTTSYIIPDDILPNVRWLAGKVRDIELVLFDIDEYCNIPDSDQLSELTELAESHDLTYTVHLPLNLNFSDKEQDISITKALKVINGARVLKPRAYVCHLECKEIPEREGDELLEWQEQRIRAVRSLVEKAEISAAELAVENLESYPIDWNEPVVRSCGTHACLDIGHLFLQKIDPVPVMKKCLPLISVVHLHGIGTRDHQSLGHMSVNAVRNVIGTLIQADFRGVVTLEVFNEADLTGSLDMIEACL